MPAHFSGRRVGTRHLIMALVGLVASVLSGLVASVPAQGAVSTPAAALGPQAGTTGDAVIFAEGVTHGSPKYVLKARAASRLTVTKSPYGSTGWRFAGRLTRAGKPYARQRVQVWIHWNGFWKNFEETKRTNDRGRVSWHTRGNLGKNSYVFQLRYPGNASTKPARSTNFRLNGR